MPTFDEEAASLEASPAPRRKRVLKNDASAPPLREEQPGHAVVQAARLKVGRRLALGFAAAALLVAAIAGAASLLAAYRPPGWLGWLITFSVGAVVAIVGIAFLIHRAITRPLRRITAQAVANEIGRSLSSALEFGQITQTLYEQIQRVVDADSFYIALYDEEQQEWETVIDVVRGRPQPSIRHSVAEGLTGYIIRSRRLLLFRTPQEVQRFNEEQGIGPVGPESKSWMGVPMVAGTRVIGVIGAENYDHAHAFRHQDLDALSSMANYVAIAIENSRLYEKSQRRLDELNALFDAGATLVSTLDPQEAVEFVCREAVRLLDATSAYVCEYGDGGKTTTVIAEYYGPEASERERVSDVGVAYLDQEYMGAWSDLYSPHKAQIGDLRLPPQQREEMERYDAKSILYFPLIARGRVFGHVEVWESRYERTFGEDEVLLGQNLSSQAGVAIENARLLQAIRETTGELTAATAAILAATAQQASGASEQSAAIAQASSTIAEVQSIAEQTSGRAQSVAGQAQRTSQVSEVGAHAVVETISGVEVVREKVETIAANILALSEQAQEIGQIIVAVNDIAARSNMLALNAAVEAARAGETGKGFSVVAQEVRTLAEQSRTATEQVREILTEIQRGVNAAVMATEEGMKGADAGMKLAGEAGQSIRELAKSVLQSTDAALQIAAAAGQQLVGMQQIAQTMENIHQVTAQSVAGARQVERAARELDRLAGRLGELVEQYQI